MKKGKEFIFPENVENILSFIVNRLSDGIVDSLF